MTHYYMETMFYWLAWMHLPITVCLMVKMTAGQELLREAVCPSVTASEEYTEQSDWRR